MDEARLVSTLDDEQIARLEMALECYLREETGELRLCSRAQWFQVSGPAVRPAMVVRPHTPDRSRVCLLYTSPSPRDRTRNRMPASA